jgi:hypothetical protein
MHENGYQTDGCVFGPHLSSHETGRNALAGHQQLDDKVACQVSFSLEQVPFAFVRCKPELISGTNNTNSTVKAAIIY